MEKVNHPAHYNLPGRKECIEEMIEIFGVKSVIAFCKCNAYKYRYRHALKGGEVDLAKAKEYEEFVQKFNDMKSPTEKEKFKARKKYHICTLCGYRVAMSNGSHCPDCAVKTSKRSSEYYQKHKKKK